jgi:hypothetical protein
MTAALAKWGPPMADLSPAADAVLDAYNSGLDRPVAVHHKPRIAAALRAAATAIGVQEMTSWRTNELPNLRCNYRYPHH